MEYGIEKVICECLERAFKERIEIYGYYDAEEYIVINRTELQKLVDFEFNKTNDCYAKDYYEFVFKGINKQKNIVEIVQYIIEFYINNKNKNLTVKLILLFVFNNIEGLDKFNYIRLSFNSLFPLHKNEELLKMYLNKNIKFVSSNKLCKYIMYDYTIVEPRIISKVQDLVNYNFKYNSLYFRGHSKVNYKLLPNIYRDVNIKEKECEVVKDSVAEYPNLLSGISTIEVLSKIQHFGGKTRLLDITLNCLVALYFASNTNKDKIGELIAFDFNSIDRKYNDSDTVSILACLSMLEDVNKKELVKYYNSKKINMDFKKINAVKKLVFSIKQERLGFDIKEFNDKVLLNSIICKANKNCERIVRQDGLFVLCGLNIDNSIEKFLNNVRLKILMNNKKKLRPIFLVTNKSTIITQLNNMGINWHYLFPEIENYFVDK